VKHLANICFLFITVAGSGLAQVTGAGAADYIPSWTGTSTLGNSVIYQHATTYRIGIRTTAPDATLEVVDSALAIHGQTGTTAGIGVRGDVTAADGSATLGVYGVADSSAGVGVRGDALSATGFNFGLLGTSDSVGGVGLGAYAEATTGSTMGIYSVVYSPDGTAGVFDSIGGGNILAGQNDNANVFRVDGTGKGYFDGGTQTGGADFAESISVAGNRSQYEPGDLLVIDPAGQRRIALSSEPYSTLVAGIYSTKPGVLATTHKLGDQSLEIEVPLAVVGIVPCKVTAEGGAIKPGDLLVTSSRVGFAMRGSDRERMLGAVVGKALEPLHGESGVIQVLVTLQ
jgi:hypothetical protein